MTRRRKLSFYREFPRQFDAAVRAHDEAELARHDAEQEGREPLEAKQLVQCAACRGAGRARGERCPMCGGSGRRYV